MKIAVRDLLPNPYRHIERYPIIEDKVENLLSSIKQTSFWDNLLARKSPAKSDKFELAYGVHRLTALKRARITEIDIPVRSLDDATMIKIMANENMEEWGHSASIEQETVRAVVEGYAKGKFDLPLNGNERGPSFDAADEHPFKAGVNLRSSAGKPYTLDSLIEFLGWKPYKVRSAMSALALIHEKLIDEKTIADLSSKQADTVAMEVRRVVKETQQPKLAAAVGRKLAAGMKRSVSGRDSTGAERNVKDVTIHNARARTDEMIKPHRAKPEPKALPNAEKFIDDLVHVMLDLPSDKLKGKVDKVIENKADIPAREVRHLISALRGVAKRFERMAERLEA